MKQNRIFFQLMLSLLLCWLLSGCVSFPRDQYVERKQYLFDVDQSVFKNRSISRVFFDNVETVAPFNQLDFVYRVSATRYLVDRYNGFLVSPAEQIDSMLRIGSGDLAIEAKRSSRLRIRLTELYADYQDRNDPRGVIAVQFVLTEIAKKDGKATVLLDKVFRSNLSLKQKDTVNLMKAWNQGLQSVMRRGLRALKNKIN